MPNRQLSFRTVLSGLLALSISSILFGERSHAQSNKRLPFESYEYTYSRSGWFAASKRLPDFTSSDARLTIVDPQGSESSVVLACDNGERLDFAEVIGVADSGRILLSLECSSENSASRAVKTFDPESKQFAPLIKKESVSGEYLLSAIAADGRISIAEVTSQPSDMFLAIVSNIDAVTEKPVEAARFLMNRPNINGPLGWYLQRSLDGSTLIAATGDLGDLTVRFIEGSTSEVLDVEVPGYNTSLLASGRLWNQANSDISDVRIRNARGTEEKQLTFKKRNSLFRFVPGSDLIAAASSTKGKLTNFDFYDASTDSTQRLTCTNVSSRRYLWSAGITTTGKAVVEVIQDKDGAPNGLVAIVKIRKGKNSECSLRPIARSAVLKK